MQVAVLGTGIMGVGMAHSLLRAGHPVRVWNRSAERARPLGEDGATVAETIEAAVDGVDAVITIVYDAAAVDAVATAMLPAMDPAAVWLQASTIGPDAAADFGRRADAAGIANLDAPVVGTKAPAEAGRLSTLVSGDSAVIDRVRPVLEAISARITVAGDRPGQASALKLVCNAWIGLLTAGIAQSIGLAEAAGLDPRLFGEAIKDTAVDSAYAQVKGPLMIDSSFQPPSFPVDGVIKDLGLIKDLATATGIRTDLIETVRRIFTQAGAAGHGQDDMAAAATQFAVPTKEQPST
ncbi:NAD(P)-dependent oxidoreductase [Microlunatus sp. Gsoil 973]|uniref:NAD(P)-dependent oxidoreductase n=1 Tax=Microlunatus sp. Gsoil 973 TaxID=2672569 RepID=UPI0012B46E2C|nr:NAD(P)-dependent oxidoreductase [Microlunatus sp. Gsoil 973]QGN31754.1 NAD-binding protein [Microlunatus sp. Gsoil 973]